MTDSQNVPGSAASAIMGTWFYGYDALNRLVSGATTSQPYAGTGQPRKTSCWWPLRLSTATSASTWS
jgi:hypothetical protein